MGGKKKSSAAGPAKKDSKFKIPVNFDCPLCDAKAAIQIKMTLKELTATVKCRACKQPEPAFQCKLNRLSKPHDAFFDYYEDLRARDEENLREHHIHLVATELNRVEKEEVIMSPGQALRQLDASAIEINNDNDDVDEDMKGIF